mmetsp:Transcript_35031/g.99661  ORF Transcript_35031/g.99661 Transcript_35031/m.99661 type:complete len:309 (+) Transcript_35031:360-1286(+)
MGTSQHRDFQRRVAANAVAVARHGLADRALLVVYAARVVRAARPRAGPNGVRAIRQKRALLVAEPGIQLLVPATPGLVSYVPSHRGIYRGLWRRELRRRVLLGVAHIRVVRLTWCIWTTIEVTSSDDELRARCRLSDVQAREARLHTTCGGRNSVWKISVREEIALFVADAQECLLVSQASAGLVRAISVAVHIEPVAQDLGTNLPLLAGDAARVLLATSPRARPNGVGAIGEQLAPHVAQAAVKLLVRFADIVVVQVVRRNQWVRRDQRRGRRNYDWRLSGGRDRRAKYGLAAPCRRGHQGAREQQA